MPTHQGLIEAVFHLDPCTSSTVNITSSCRSCLHEVSDGKGWLMSPAAIITWLLIKLTWEWFWFWPCALHPDEQLRIALNPQVGFSISVLFTIHLSRNRFSSIPQPKVQVQYNKLYFPWEKHMDMVWFVDKFTQSKAPVPVLNCHSTNHSLAGNWQIISMRISTVPPFQQIDHDKTDAKISWSTVQDSSWATMQRGQSPTNP